MPPSAPRPSARQECRIRRSLCVALAAAAVPLPAWAVKTLLHDLEQPQGVALDVTGGRIYWAEVSKGTVSRAYLGGDLRPEAIIHTPLGNLEDAPYGVALDHKAGKVYWTTTRAIFRADLNGSNVEPVVNASCGGGIALDVQENVMYWTSWHDGVIYRMHLNSSNPEEFISDGVEMPIDLALDLNRKKVYWTDTRKKTVERANLDGTETPTALALAVNLRGSVVNMSCDIRMTNGIAIDPLGGQIYLTGSADVSAGQAPGIYRSHLFGESESELLFSGEGLEKPWGIAYDHEGNTVYWTDQKAGTLQSLALRCDSGSIEVPSSTGRPSSARVAYITMRHSELSTSKCPMNYSGEVRLMCSDGTVSVSSGHCSKDCPAGSLNVTNTSYVAYDAMKSGNSTEAACGKNLVGDMRIKCLEGVVSIASGFCRAPRGCAAGSLLFGTAKLTYNSMAHEQFLSRDCPDGFEGNYSLTCEDGEVSAVEGRCDPNCDEGTIWIDNGGGLVEVYHGSINPGGRMKVPCPPDYSAGEGARLECREGTIRVLQSQCFRICEKGSKIIGGARISHGAMNQGEVQSSPCPAGFSGNVSISCKDGDAAYTGNCHAQCPSGVFNDSHNISVSYQAIDHGGELKITCPEGYHGLVPLRCINGNITLNCGFENASRCDCQKVAIHDEDVQSGGTERHEDIQHERDGPEHGSEEHDAPIRHPAREHASASAHSSSTTRSVGLRGGAHSEKQRQEEEPVIVLVAAIAGSVAFVLVASCVAWQVVRRRRKQRMSACPPPPAPSKAAKCIAETLCWPVGWSGSGDSSTADPNSISEMNDIVIDSLVPLPSYWATQEGMHIFPDPNRVNEVQQLMNDTWRVIATRDRRLISGDGRVPVGCRVASVLRIENHAGYDKYWKHKSEVTGRRSGAGSACEAFKLETDNRLNLLDPECNEKYLFHGTNPESAHAIARSLFRIDMAGSCRGCMFGPGVYLAENASKSDEYAKEGSGVYLGLCAMLVCRAVAGRVLNVETSADFSERITSGEYDSLCGDRLAAVGTFREMVFFHEEAVYPEFIVIYARVYGDY